MTDPFHLNAFMAWETRWLSRSGCRRAVVTEYPVEGEWNNAGIHKNESFTSVYVSDCGQSENGVET